MLARVVSFTHSKSKDNIYQNSVNDPSQVFRLREHADDFQVAFFVDRFSSGGGFQRSALGGRGSWRALCSVGRACVVFQGCGPQIVM